MKDTVKPPEPPSAAPTPDPLEFMRDSRHGLVINFPAGTPRRERVIPAARLMRLAKNFKTEVGVPVRINNAVITGDLILPGAAFAHGLAITKTIFQGEVNLSQATFESGLDLSGSIFWGGADFRAARFARDCVMKRTRFRQSCHFDDAHFGGSFAARGARFGKDVSFRQARFDSSASFRCYVFQGPRGGAAAPPAPKVFATVFGGRLNFARATVEGLFSFEGAQFKGKVDFQRAQLRNTTDFSSYTGGDDKPLLSRTRFNKEADFTACEIGAGAAFLGVAFKESVNFERLSVGGHLLFKPLKTAAEPVGTWFGDGAKFLGARVHNNAEFDGAVFVGEANFDRFEVERNVYFRPAFHGEHVWGYTTFLDTADFVGMHVKGDAEFTGATFMKDVRLESIHVEGNALFDDEYDAFNRPVKRVLPVFFKGDVNLVSAHFKHRTKFNRAAFQHEAHLESADFEGAAIFTDVQFGRGANFTGSRFGQYADFQRTTFEAAADFVSVEAGGGVFFTGASFLGPTSFKAASFKALDFMLSPPPAGRENFGGSLNLSGFTYELISINDELLGSIFGSLTEYNRQAFTQLERVLRSIGEDDSADETYLRRRRREREERRKRREKDAREIAPDGWRGAHYDAAIVRWLNGLGAAFFDRTQSAVVNYGIRPFTRLLAISLAVLFVGSLMFWREGAVVPRESGAGASYVLRRGEGGEMEVAPAEKAADPVQLGFTQAVGVSFNQFIPIVQIPSGSKWKPSEKLIPLPDGTLFYYFSYAFYGSIHSLLGAVLVPLGVAALTGILHRRERPGR
jgi:hypothetical protein